jgi:hypothetical protein
VGKSVLARTATDGIVAVLIDWRLPALAAVGLCAVVLNQNAYQAGNLAGPLTGIVLTDPLGSVAIAVLAYDERIRTGAAALTVEMLALVAMALGVWLVSHAGFGAPRGPGHRAGRQR